MDQQRSGPSSRQHRHARGRPYRPRLRQPRRQRRLWPRGRTQSAHHKMKHLAAQHPLGAEGAADQPPACAAARPVPGGRVGTSGWETLSVRMQQLGHKFLYESVSSCSVSSSTERDACSTLLAPDWQNVHKTLRPIWGAELCTLRPPGSPPRVPEVSAPEGPEDSPESEIIFRPAVHF